MDLNLNLMKINENQLYAASSVLCFNFYYILFNGVMFGYVLNRFHVKLS